MMGAYLVQSRKDRFKFKDPSFRWSNEDEVFEEDTVVWFSSRLKVRCPMKFSVVHKKGERVNN